MKKINVAFFKHCCFTIILFIIASNIQAQTVFVDAARPDNSGDGLSWSTAKKDLQVAINTASMGSQVWVKGGTYYPTVDPFGNAAPADPRDKTFLLAENVKIYGGFAGTETSLSERDLMITANKSTLNGDIGIIGNDNDNAYHVVVGAGSLGTAELNGFTITKGIAYNITGTSITINGQQIFRYHGGGLAFKNASPVLNNLIISNNYAIEGGGIHNESASPFLMNSLITNNNVQNNGGGIRNVSNSSAQITNCIIRSNVAAMGGGMSNEFSSPLIINSFIAGNNASTSGGGIYNMSSSSKITNTIISGNTTKKGAGIFNDKSSPTLTNSTISGNSASVSGGAIYISVNGVVKVNNSIIYNNNTGLVNDPLIGPLITLSNSLVQGFPADAANGNLDGNTDPLFTSPLSPGLNTGGDYSLAHCSPAINAGKNLDVPLGITTDISGNNRIQFDKVDMGAYESIADPLTAPIATTNSSVKNNQSTTGRTFYGNNCNELLASVQGDGTGTSVNGNTTAKVWIESIQPSKFVKRHYEITPESNAGTATGTVVLYFTQGEFDDFNADPTNLNKLPSGPLDAIGMANLLVEQRGGVSDDGTGIPDTYPGTILTIKPFSILWNSSVNYWEVSLHVTGFSGFFVKSITEALPVRWLSFSGKLNNRNRAQLIWKVEEYNVTGYEIEKSIDGRNFTKIADVISKGNGSQSYLFTDTEDLNGNTYFRIKQTDKDGKAVISSIVKLSVASASLIKIYPNPVKNTLILTTGNDMLHSKATLSNGHGQKLMEMLITGNKTTIDISRLAKGLYILQLSDGTAQKIIKD